MTTGTVENDAVGQSRSTVGLGITIEELEYPNPEYKYGIFRLDGEKIGKAEKVGEWWTKRGGRKVMSAEQMAEALLRDAIKDARRRTKQARADEFSAMMQLSGMLSRKAPTEVEI